MSDDKLIREALAAVRSGEKLGVYYSLAQCTEWLPDALRDVIAEALEHAIFCRMRINAPNYIPDPWSLT